MNLRTYIGVIVAVIADLTQVGTTAFTLGSSQISIPLQLVFAGAVAVVLGILMGPHPRLLAPLLIEVVPFGNLLPGFTFAAIRVARDRKKLG